MARTRRLIGLLCLLALVGIAVGLSGFELPLPRPGATNPQRLLPGVAAAATTLLLKVPAGGDLAFLAVEPSGNLVVTDRARTKIMRFDAAGDLLSEWGPRLGDLTLTTPAGVAVQNESIYVLDRGTPRVFRLDTTGRVQFVFSLERLGTYGLNGLAIDQYGLLYAADTGHNRILVFTPDGNPTREFGRQGSGPSEFLQPMALAFSPDGTFTVADWENSRLERWDATYSAINDWSVGFRPFGVAADQQGRIYAPDSERRRIVAYTPRGDVLGEIGAPGQPAIDVAPRELAFAPSQPNALYVLGGDGIVRLDLQDAPPPAQGGSDVDILGPVLFAMLLALPVLAFLMRRGRGESVPATAYGPVGLHAENGAQRQQQQAHANQQLLIADQSECEHQARDKDHQTVGDRQTRH